MWHARHNDYRTIGELCGSVPCQVHTCHYLSHTYISRISIICNVAVCLRQPLACNWFSNIYYCIYISRRVHFCTYTHTLSTKASSSCAHPIRSPSPNYSRISSLFSSGQLTCWSKYYNNTWRAHVCVRTCKQATRRSSERAGVRPKFPKKSRTPLLQTGNGNDAAEVVAMMHNHKWNCCCNCRGEIIC